MATYEPPAGGKHYNNMIFHASHAYTLLRLQHEAISRRALTHTMQISRFGSARLSGRRIRRRAKCESAAMMLAFRASHDIAAERARGWASSRYFGAPLAHALIIMLPTAMTYAILAGRGIPRPRHGLS